VRTEKLVKYNTITHQILLFSWFKLKYKTNSSESSYKEITLKLTLKPFFTFKFSSMLSKDDVPFTALVVLFLFKT